MSFAERRRNSATWLADQIVGNAWGSMAVRSATLASRRRGSRRWLHAMELHLRSALVRDPRFAVATLPTGSPMVVSLGDWLHQELAFLGLIEGDVTGLMVALGTPGWTVLDVGANAGYFSLLAADIGGAGARVHAFEPHPRIADWLAANVALSAADRVRVWRVACGAEAGHATLHLGGVAGNVGVSSLVRAHVPAVAGEVEVETVRLDEACREAGIVPDFAKVDVEGSEGLALDGMTALLEAGAPRRLVIELAATRGRPEPKSIVLRLREYGYGAWSLAADGTPRSYTPQPMQNVFFEYLT